MLVATVLAVVGMSVVLATSSQAAAPEAVSYQNLGYPWYAAPKVDVSQGDWGYTNCPSDDKRCFALTSTTSGANCRQGSSGCYGVADPWEYGLRNCTSFVAWYLANHNIPLSDFNFSTVGKGNADQWLQDAQSYPWNTRLTTGSVPEVGSVAVQESPSPGHVMLVTAVNTNGTITVEEYNYNYHGDGDIRTATLSAMGINGYIYYNAVPGSTTGVVVVGAGGPGGSGGSGGSPPYAGAPVPPVLVFLSSLWSDVQRVFQSVTKDLLNWFGI